MRRAVINSLVLSASLLAACVLVGCHLVDQRDFDARAGRRPTPPVMAGPTARPVPALVTISYAVPDPAYRAQLTDAVHRALARKPDVLFTVTTLVPGAADPATQATAAEGAAGSGREVAQAIVDSGAASGQVEQVVRVQPGLPAREVRVDVH